MTSTNMCSISVVSGVVSPVNRNYALLLALVITKRTAKKSTSGSECFPICIGVCATFFNRGASRYGSKGLEKMLLDRVANESAIVDIFSFGLHCLTGSIIFSLREVTGKYYHI